MSQKAIEKIELIFAIADNDEPKQAKGEQEATFPKIMRLATEALAELKVEQPPASKLQCPECGKRDTDIIVDIVNFGGNDIYVPVHRCKCGFKWTDDVAGNVWDRNNILIKLIKARLDASQAENRQLKGEEPIPFAWYKDCPKLAQKTMERIIERFNASEASRKELETRNANQIKKIEAMEQERIEEIDTLIAALEKYGDHEAGCIKGDACNCGLKKAIEKGKE